MARFTFLLCLAAVLVFNVMADFEEEERDKRFILGTVLGVKNKISGVKDRIKERILGKVSSLFVISFLCLLCKNLVYLSTLINSSTSNVLFRLSKFSSRTLKSPKYNYFSYKALIRNSDSQIAKLQLTFTLFSLIACDILVGKYLRNVKHWKDFKTPCFEMFRLAQIY